MVEIQQAYQLHHWKTTAGILAGWLRVLRLVAWAIRHLRGGAIDCLDAVSPPANRSGAVPFELRKEVPMNLAQHLLRQSLPSLHVTGGVGAGSGQTTLAIPLLHLADRLGTGAVLAEHLAQKRPESHFVGVEPTAGASARNPTPDQAESPQRIAGTLRRGCRGKEIGAAAPKQLEPSASNCQTSA